VMIYGIGLETEFFNGQMVVRSKPDSILNRFANETGGGYFDLKKGADLNTSFTRIAQELRSQYLLGFSPAALDGKVHRLEVRVKRSGLKARSRRSYTATAEGTMP
jgi:Ca-activated chloride channel family protein